ncbi:MAG: hypothetical protein LBU66_05795 [Treponema sp.]|jgi:hypothetical protein|nr:hypothetical protein [Treponema sp.]
MRIQVKRCLGQLPILLLVFILSSCGGRNESAPALPPLTSPLSRDYIGFGVITASFTHITEEPAQDSVSLFYMRRGSLARVVKRQSVRTGNVFTSWVMIDEPHHGWLKENEMEIYNNESQAKTASEAMQR